MTHESREKREKKIAPIIFDVFCGTATDIRCFISDVTDHRTLSHDFLRFYLYLEETRRSDKGEEVSLTHTKL